MNEHALAELGKISICLFFVVIFILIMIFIIYVFESIGDLKRENRYLKSLVHDRFDYFSEQSQRISNIESRIEEINPELN